MKRIFLFLIGTVAAVLAGCNKTPGVGDVPAGKSAQLTITLTKSAVSTKATEAGTENEGKINTVDVFVFNSTGDLDAYDQFDFSSTPYSATNKPNLDCTTGSGKIVYCLVNGEWTKSHLASTISTEANLKALVFSLDKNCTSGATPALSNFEMVGSNTKDFTPGANTISVSVKRAVARVRLQKITRKFSSSALADGQLKIKDIYISNAVGAYGLDGTVKSGADNTWYNKYAYDNTTPHTPYPGYININAAMNLWLHNDIEDVTIAQNASATTAIASTFYVMPNQVAYDAADGGTGAWAPRRTKLVIEVEYTPVGGTAKTYYYTIPICEQDTYPEITDNTTYKGLNANVTYDITELELTRLGSTNPDEPVVAADVEVTLKVLPWDIYPLETETGKYVI